MKEHLSKSDKPIGPAGSGVTERDLLTWRKKLDESKAKTKQKTEHLSLIQQQLGDLDLLDSNQSSKSGGHSSDLKNVRILENRLDKAIIKLNEATSIQKTYGVILSKLKEESLMFDKQLANIEEQVRTKGIEFDEMLLLSHDANHAK